MSIAYNRSVDSITGSASHITNNGALLTHQGIENRRLAHVRTANQCNLNFILVIHTGSQLITGEFGNHCVQQITQAQMVGSRNRNRVTNAQIIEFEDIHLLLRRIGLVHSQHNRLFGLAQQACYICILGSNTAASIADEQDYISLFNSNLSLLANRNGNGISVHDFDTTGIHHHKFMVQPFSCSIKTVTSDTGGVLNNRNPAVGKYIE